MLFWVAEDRLVIAPWMLLYCPFSPLLISFLCIGKLCTSYLFMHLFVLVHIWQWSRHLILVVSTMVLLREGFHLCHYCTVVQCSWNKHFVNSYSFHSRFQTFRQGAWSHYALQKLPQNNNLYLSADLFSCICTKEKKWTEGSVSFLSAWQCGERKEGAEHVNVSAKKY